MRGAVTISTCSSNSFNMSLLHKIYAAWADLESFRTHDCRVGGFLGWVGSIGLANDIFQKTKDLFTAAQMTLVYAQIIFLAM